MKRTPIKTTAAKLCGIGEAARTKSCCETLTESNQWSSPLTCAHDFDVVLRKLIPKLQAFSKRIQETPMVRFYSSIYADDKVLIRQMSCVSAFHGSPHQIAAAHRTKTECLDSVPDAVQLSLIRVRNSLFLAQRRDICGGSCRNATGLGAFLTFLQVAKSLEYKPDR